MTFSADLTNPNCLITVFLDEHWVISCRVGDPRWKRHFPYNYRLLVDATCYNGRLYLLYEGEMAIFESNEVEQWSVLVPELTVVFEPELTAVSKRFVEGKSGVYVVGIHPEEKFELYEFQDQQMKLKKITTDTCDNTAIFYGDNYPCLALSSDDWDLLDGDSLYMEHKCVPGAWKLAQWADVPEDEEARFQRVGPSMWFQPSYF